jgi:lipopolysaccharide assembly outer membrane protein LptD (OstA)
VNGTYSTCEGPDPDWYLKSSTLRLDQGRDVGLAGRTTIYFKGMPILATPALSFSMSGARRSGWLPAIPGVGSKGSAEVMVPYYFNIAPNRDLTVYPRYIFARGLQLGATGRYMGETSAGPYAGETHIEAMANDRMAGMRMRHPTTNTRPTFRARWQPAPSASCCASCAPATARNTGASTCAPRATRCFRIRAPRRTRR